uniref:Uncharacterized protein n=1 Tax=Pipistrellus kuhlii TaxID=59472 RepID=A0A7J7ZJS2_PIPKU|nr:hypothetical protein mPipKuh1_009432 [Pipistrellus kuhlii]
MTVGRIQKFAWKRPRCGTPPHSLVPVTPSPSQGGPEAQRDEVAGLRLHQRRLPLRGARPGGSGPAGACALGLWTQDELQSGASAIPDGLAQASPAGSPLAERLHQSRILSPLSPSWGSPPPS